MAIDYEKEYDNRGRVPEHPEIFARWQREAAAFREAALDADLGNPYGPSPRQTIDLFPAKDDDDLFPAKDDDASTPLALFIHGGWWRSLEPAMFSQMAAGPNAKGVTVAVAGYDLCPQVTIAAIIAQMRTACLLWSTAIPPAGISQPACWRRIGRRSPPTRRLIWCRVPMRFRACSISRRWSIFQSIRTCGSTRRKRGAFRRFIGGRVSPLYWRVPASRVFDTVVGALESSEFLRQSGAIAEAWRLGMAQTRYEKIAGKNHFTVVDALTDPGSAMTRRVSDLAHSVNAIAL